VIHKCIFFGFSGNAYAVLLDNGMVPGYPRHISEKFDGLEGVSKIDAALSWERHNTPRLYLFSVSISNGNAISMLSIFLIETCPKFLVGSLNVLK